MKSLLLFLFGLKKKPRPESRIFPIPKDRMLELAELFDADTKERTKVSKYKLWKFIADIVPEVRRGNWRISTDNALEFWVEEVITDDFSLG